MSELHRRALVRCPEARAAEHLAGFVRSCADSSGCVHLAIRASVELPRLQTAIALKRDVLVTVGRESCAEGGETAYRVDWIPADGGAFPRLTGTLTTFEDGPSGFMLIFNGKYRSVSPAPEHSCDGTLAYRIAQATARDFLLHVRDHIERSVREDGCEHRRLFALHALGRNAL